MQLSKLVKLAAENLDRVGGIETIQTFVEDWIDLAETQERLEQAVLSVDFEAEPKNWVTTIHFANAAVVGFLVRKNGGSDDLVFS